MYNEISEEAFKILMKKIESQIYRIESGKPQIKNEDEEDSFTFFEKLLHIFQKLLSKNTDIILARYMISRARKVTADKAIKGLVVLQ